MQPNNKKTVKRHIELARLPTLERRMGNQYYVENHRRQIEQADDGGTDEAAAIALAGGTGDTGEPTVVERERVDPYVQPSTG